MKEMVQDEGKQRVYNIIHSVNKMSKRENKEL